SNRELGPADVKLGVLVLLSHAHGSEAAAVARPIFAAYANEISHRGTETQRLPTLADEPNDQNVSTSPGRPYSASSVRIHLVHDNVTQELSLEDYVLGVMRAEGSMESEPEALKALAISIRTYALQN